MKTIIELISNEVMTAFKEAGYDENMGKVTLSNRPDLCEYQCNGAMAGAKVYHKAPIMIANDVVAKLAGSKVLEMAEAVNPGFINLKVSGAYMAQYLEEMRNSEKMGVEEAKDPLITGKSHHAGIGDLLLFRLVYYRDVVGCLCIFPAWCVGCCANNRTNLLLAYCLVCEFSGASSLFNAFY